MSLSTYYLEYGRHVARFRPRRRHRRRAYAPANNTASHDIHEKINLWVSFFSLYEYGAPLGGPSGRRSSAKLGTLRYATARCCCGYFGREGLGWQRCFTRQTHMIKILLYGSGMCSLYVSLQKWLLSRKPEIILLSYEIALINDKDFLLLNPSYISQNSDLPFQTW